MDDKDLELIAETYVLKATRHAIYAAEDDGLPTDADQRAAWQAAIKAQVDAWKQADIAGVILTGGANAAARVSSTSNKGASLTYDYSQADTATQKLLDGGLAPLAHAHLFKAGLIGNLPGVIR